jgi:beta-glucanase (GH16 family)
MEEPMKTVLIMATFAISVYVVTACATPPAGYGLVWSDEFNGTTLDTVNTWTYKVGAGTNSEQEYYTLGSNLTMENGSAVLWAKHETVGGQPYSSCRISTKDKKDFGYGYYEVRLKAPQGKGLWPAFWSEGKDIDSVKWPNCGEMEFYETKTGADGYGGGYGDKTFIATCHYGVNGTAKYNSSPIQTYTEKLSLNYHLYAIKRTAGLNEYYFDDVKFWQYATTNLDAFKQNFFFLANIAVGGDFQGQSIDNTIFPQKMYIDYIRVYQPGVGIQTLRAKQEQFSLVHPASARLVAFDVKGRIVADLTNKVRALAAGADVNDLLSRTLVSGSYQVSLSDNGRTQTRRIVAVR